MTIDNGEPRGGGPAAGRGIGRCIHGKTLGELCDECPSGKIARDNIAAASVTRRTQAIRERCEQQQSACIFPKCDDCGFDRLVDRERESRRPADPDLVKTREFQPNEIQLMAVNAIYQALGVSCKTPEEAVALLTYAVTDYLERITKKDKLPEAIETVIQCLRFNINA